jgi:hypothetical protein
MNERPVIYPPNVLDALDALMAHIDAVARTPYTRRCKERQEQRNNRYTVTRDVMDEIDKAWPVFYGPSPWMRCEGLTKVGWVHLTTGYGGDTSYYARWYDNPRLIARQTYGKQAFWSLLENLKAAGVPWQRLSYARPPADYLGERKAYEEGYWIPGWALWCCDKRRSKTAIPMLRKLHKNPELQAAMVSQVRLTGQPFPKNGGDKW